MGSTAICSRARLSVSMRYTDELVQPFRDQGLDLVERHTVGRELTGAQGALCPSQHPAVSLRPVGLGQSRDPPPGLQGAVHAGQVEGLSHGGHDRAPLPVELRDILWISAARTCARDASANSGPPGGVPVR